MYSGPKLELGTMVGGSYLVGHVLAGELGQGVGARDLHFPCSPAGRARPWRRGRCRGSPEHY